MLKITNNTQNLHENPNNGEINDEIISIFNLLENLNTKDSSKIQPTLNHLLVPHASISQWTFRSL